MQNALYPKYNEKFLFEKTGHFCLLSWVQIDASMKLWVLSKDFVFTLAQEKKSKSFMKVIFMVLPEKNYLSGKLGQF